MSSIFSTTLPAGARVVILGTGGTIAGTGHDPKRPWAYQAAQLGVADLLAGVPDLAVLQPHLAAEQVAQVDSKDMGWPVWRALAAALARELADPAVLGVVITHGTDTLEETAALLHWLAPRDKPIVLTAAMRPATAADADGPANLSDAVAAVLHAWRARQGGVLAALQGRIWSARDVRKAHSHAVDAFDGGGAEPWLTGTPGQGHAGPWPSRPWPVAATGQGLGWQWVAQTASQAPPRVALLTSHADADGEGLRAWLTHPVARPQGVVVACSGHGTIHSELWAALREAQAQGVVVWRSSRVARGGVLPRDGDEWPACGHWTAAQARLGLQLTLMGAPIEMSGA
ncbi:MAG: hypothetical protein RI907_742 [Pseudomonadota bacterium]